jgi:hypothetical protein
VAVTFTIRSGPWSHAVIEAFLDETAIPIRLATSGAGGPVVQSLWFRYENGSLWCATQRDSVLARRLERDDRVGWEVSGDDPPYRGVRGTGQATLNPEASPVLRLLIERYGQSGTPLADWLLSRTDNEVAVRITDLYLTSWDFSPRMT